MRASVADRPARIARRLRAAAQAHDAPVWRVALRAARLQRGGWRMGEAATLGLLDPHLDLREFPWAVRAAELERLQEDLNPEGAVPLAEDKRLFAEACDRHGLPAARQPAVLERAGGPAATAAAWAGTLERAAPEGLVVKPADGHRGLGVRVLRRHAGGVRDHDGRTASWESLARELAAEPWGAYVVQERLRPHPDLVRMSGHDLVHTLRLVTLLDDGGRPRLIAARMRVAVGGQAVDSFRAGATGNLSALVRDDGTLGTPLRLCANGFGLERVRRHPRTGVDLEGFPVPGWEEARALALRAGRVFAPLRTIGWDIAPTPEGPALIEANAWWSFLPEPSLWGDPTVAALREAAGRSARPA